MDYETARSLAGSLGTVFLVVSFLGVVLFALRPGSKRAHSDSAEIPFRHDNKPIAATTASAPLQRDTQEVCK